MLTLLMLSACAVNNEKLQSHSIFSQDKIIFLMPASSVIKVFRDDAARFNTVLVQALKDLGYECKIIEESQYKTFRAAAFEESGSVYSPKSGDFAPLDEQIYVDSFTRQLKTFQRYDLLIFPELVLRKVPLTGELLMWDGVEERLLVQGPGSRMSKMPSVGRGLSIQLPIYRADGALKAVYYGGIAAPYYLDRTQQQAEFKLRQEFINKANIASSIAIAIEAFRK